MNEKEGISKRKALGRGLGALLPVEQIAAGGGIQFIRINEIVSSRYQPRRHFEGIKIRELAQSIKEKGILQPIIVRKAKDGYELIAGERRLRAAKIANLEEIPAIVKDISEEEALQIALIENIQREDLNPIEEAEAYQYLIEKFGYSQEEIAKKIGKERTTIANTLRLLRLPREIKDDLIKGNISAGHARAILSLGKMKLQLKARDHIIKKKLSVRETEEFVKRLSSAERSASVISRRIPSEIKPLEDELRKILATKVQIHFRKGRGRVVIYFFSREELERIMELIIKD